MEREKAEELVKLVATALGVDMASLGAAQKAGLVSDVETWLRDYQPKMDFGY